jgi:hypothetical protein
MEESPAFGGAFFRDTKPLQQERMAIAGRTTVVRSEK